MVIQMKQEPSWLTNEGLNNCTRAEGTRFSVRLQFYSRTRRMQVGQEIHSTNSLPA